jgi:hypothetical protein
MTDDTVTVYVAKTANRKGKYHTDRQCDSAPDRPREWTLADADKMGYDLCDLCEADGDWGEITDAASDQRRSLRAMLREDDVDHIEHHPEVGR